VRAILATLTGRVSKEARMKRTSQRTFDAIQALLRDGAWHGLDDLKAATNYPAEWVEELEAEGLVDVNQGVVTMVRLRPTVAS
jgi:hypothetical protein